MGRRPWLTLLACAAAAGQACAQAGADGGGLASADPPVVDSTAAAPGLPWRGAPVALSGWVAYDLRASRAAGEPGSLSHLVTSGLSARSYIYQPWFATVNGTLGVTAGRSRPDSEAGGTSDRFVTGNGRIDLFPRSRFPFELHVERSDSRTDSALASTIDFSTRNVGLSQRYRPVSGAYTLNASFDRREQLGAGFRDTQDLLAADFGTRWKHSELSVGLSQSEARRQASDERTQFRSLVARHAYAPGSSLSVNSTVNLTRTEEHAAFGASEISVLQGSSIGLWHREGSPLTLSASARALVLHDALADRRLDSVGLTLGLGYELTPNARLTANASATSTGSAGQRTDGLSGSVGASWQGDTVAIGGLRYDRYANGNLGGSRAAQESQISAAAQLGHSMSRSWPVTPQSTLVLNGGQSLSVARNHISGSSGADAPQLSSRAALHTVSATWSTGGDNRSAYARAAYSDSNELGGGRSRFQLFNFQLSGNFEFDRNRSLAGDLTVQRVRQRQGEPLAGSEGPPADGSSSSGGASGEVTYRHLRPFGIARLRFSSRLKLARDVLNQPGTFATVPDRETRLWENRLDWAAGRLETQLVLRISQIDGRRREFLMWRVQRSFGN